MNTYLLTWNPNRWQWEDLAEVGEKTAAGEPHQMRWSCGVRKNIVAGDRLFLLRQGKEPRGIIAAGRANGSVVEDVHWDGSGGNALYVFGTYDRILNPELEAPLSVSDISTGPLASVAWNTQASGIQIPDNAANLLEDLWEVHLEELPSAQSHVARNPPWQRDELILALDLYVQHGGKYLSESHHEIIELSEVLNSLPIHVNKASAKFRNPNGVKMKLLNFRRFDPTQAGVGLTRGNKLEKEVWEQYAGKPDVLHKIAASIRAGFQSVEDSHWAEPEEESFPEGRIMYRLHRLRERNKGLIDKAKAKAMQQNGGKVCCCVCSFDFAEVYGKLGKDFIEGHHTKPLSELNGTAKSKVSDIALVCSNCHRMLHRRRPWLVSIGELQSILSKTDL